MKIAIISDIHSNPAALRNVLRDSEENGCERTICLGDIVGYGYDPVSCIDVCMKKCSEGSMKCVMGNHDACLSGKMSISWFSKVAAEGVRRQKGVVSRERINFLAALPYYVDEEFGGRKMRFSHGTFDRPQEFGYDHYLSDVGRDMWFMEVRGFDCTFIGHTHYATAFVKGADGLYKEFGLADAPDLAINLGNWSRVVANVGSVGYPRMQSSTTYAVLDTDTLGMRYHILPFDYNGYMEEMRCRSIEIPAWMTYAAQRERRGSLPKGKAASANVPGAR